MASDAWLGTWRTSLATGFVLSTALGVVLGVIGPFGSYQGGGLGVRVLYWTASLWAGWLLFGVALPVVARSAVRRRWPWWAWLPAAVVVLAIPAALVGRLLAQAVWPGVGRIGAVEWYGQFLAISALANGLIFWRVLAGQPEAPAPDSADPRDRLPPALGREVLCLRIAPLPIIAIAPVPGMWQPVRNCWRNPCKQTQPDPIICYYSGTSWVGIGKALNHPHPKTAWYRQARNGRQANKTQCLLIHHEPDR